MYTIVKHTIKNGTFFYFLEKATKLFFGTLLVLILPQYIRPQDFGFYSLAESIQNMAIVIALFGIEATLVKVLIDAGDKAWPCVLKSALKLRFIGVLISLVFLSICGIYFIDKAYYLYFAIISLSVFFSPLNLSEFLFQYKLRFNEIGKLRFIVAFISGLIRLLAIYSNSPLLYLSISIVIEWALLGGLFFILSRKSFKKSSTCETYLHRSDFLILREAVPALLASLSIIVYSRIDQVMLASILGYSEVAAYSIVVKLTDSFVFIPALLSTIFLPKIYREQHSIAKKKLLLRNLFNLNLVIAFLVIVTLLIFSRFILMFYPDDIYKIVPRAMTTYSVCILLNFIGVIVSQILIFEGRGMIRLLRLVFGMICNVVLNFFLIPYYGIFGAIYATIISLFIANILFVITSPATKELSSIMLNSFCDFITLKAFSLKLW